MSDQSLQNLIKKFLLILLYLDFIWNFYGKGGLQS